MHLVTGKVGSPKATNSCNALIVSSISSKDGFSPGPYGLGLQVVAPVAGYTWADGDFDGEESVNARRVARGVDKQALETRSRLLRYNEDDCRATARVREWMRAGAPGTPLIR